tara:strand:- start:772 stop:1941 length:1170 start_codon:yes stop_codon:yes gene_type:complete
VNSKIATSIFAFLVLLITLTGCSGSSNTTNTALSNSKDADIEVGEELDTSDEQEPVFLSTADIEEQLGDAVWKVATNGCDIESGGSSFAIAPNIFITNEHVTGPDMTPTLISRNGETLEGVVIGADRYLDVAVVKVSEPVDFWLEWANPDELREGEKVVSLGYPAPYYQFSVSAGSIISFLREGSSRIGIVSDEASDYGSSGGPLISEIGQVVGVITKQAAEGGAQLLGESFTYSHLGGFIESSIEKGTAVTETCDGYAYGTNIIGDYLWDLCSDGNYWACDTLYDLGFALLPVGGEYTNFGATCGDRVETEDYCVDHFKSFTPINYGDDPNLDALYDECAEGNGDSCDLLFFASPGTDGEYYSFGLLCGDNEVDAVFCGPYVTELIQE